MLNPVSGNHEIIVIVVDCLEGYWKCPSTDVCIPEALRCEAGLTIAPHMTAYEYYMNFYPYFKNQYCDCPVSRHGHNASDVTCEDELHCGKTS